MKTIVVSAAVIALLAPVAFAHDTWMICKPPHIDSGGTAALHITTGEAFPALDFAPKPERIASCEWRIGGKQGSFDSFDRQEKSLVVSGRVTTDGVAVIYTMFEPTDIDLEPGDVAEYMDEIGAPESVRKAWQDAGADAPFHETYTKQAKTYLRVGDSGDATGCLGPVGFNIDFLPESDPTALKLGDKLIVKVIRGGDELSGFSVGAVRGSKSTKQRTNQNGKVVFEIDTPGWWLVRGTELRRKADGTWESDFTTLTFFVEK